MAIIEPDFTVIGRNRLYTLWSLVITECFGFELDFACLNDSWCYTLLIARGVAVAGGKLSSLSPLFPLATSTPRSLNFVRSFLHDSKHYRTLFFPYEMSYNFD